MSRLPPSSVPTIGCPAAPAPAADAIRDCGSDLLSAALPPRAWRKRLSGYAKPDAARAARQLLITAALLLGSAGLLFWGLAQGVWLALACALPTAFFVVRLFIIQHDCGHGSYFRSRRLNDALGSVISVITTIPYATWRRDHAVHHASCGNLDRRGIGDVMTLTIAEYRARSRWQRFGYRLYRHPLVLFLLGPAWLLLGRYRVPTGSPLSEWHNWLSVLGTDVAAAALWAGLAALIGPIAVLAGWGTVLLVAMAIGVWFFYVQHQFERTYWRHEPGWDFYVAAAEGSSFYDLPRPLHWLTGWIGFHHIHHLSSRIPNYNLRACFDENPGLQRANRVTVWDSLKAVRLALWDEQKQRLVSFRQGARAG